jgi:hypothetical protein
MMKRGLSRKRGLALGAVLLGEMVLAQQGAGQELRFSLDQRFEVTDNQLLTPVSPGRTFGSSTGLSFSYSATTAASAFQFGGGAVLRATTRLGKGRIATEDPSLRLSYTRSAATSEFGLSARVTSNNIALLRPLEDFIDPATGEFIPPEDLDDLTGSGTRIGYGADARLRLWDHRRIGATLRAGISGIDYRGTTNPALVDNRRVTAGLGLRFSLAAVTDATVDLGWSEYFDVQPARETVTLGVGLSHERPDGRLTARISTERRAGTTRYGINVGRSYDLPNGALSFGVGASWGDIGKSRPNGTLSWTHDLPDGQIRLSFSHGLTTGTDDSTRKTTVAILGWQRRITDVGALSLDIGSNRSLDLGTNTSVINGTLGLAYSHQITDDWALSAGYRFRQRAQAGVKARSNTAFVTLRRDFVTRF